MAARIRVDRSKIVGFCVEHQIRKLAFFGSVLRDDFRAESDVDILVEFKEGREPGLIALAGMEQELSSLIGRKVDLRTPEDLSRYFREEVVSSAEVQYAAE